MKSLYRVISISQEGKVYVSYIITEDVDKITKEYRSNGHNPRCIQYRKQVSEKEPFGIVNLSFELLANSWEIYIKLKMQKSLKYWGA